MANAPREDNRIVGLVAKSTADNTVVVVEADPTTKRLLVNTSISSISGTTVSEYAEDATHTSGDGGVMALAVRNDTLGSLTDADGDYASLQINANGALYTEIATVPAPLNVTGGGTEAAAQRVTIANDSTGKLTVDTTGTSGLEVIQATAADLNVTEASGVAIKNSVEIMDDWDETNRAKVNIIAGQAGIAGGTGIDGATVPRVTLATDIGLPEGANEIGVVISNLGATDNAVLDSIDAGVFLIDEQSTNVAIISGAVASGQMQVDVVAALPTGDNNIGNVDIVSIDGTSVSEFAEDDTHTSGDKGVMALAVRNDTLGTLTNADGDYASLQINASGALYTEVQGNIAHSTTAAGNPLQTAGEARSSERSAVSNAEVARLTTDLVGKIINLPYAPPELFLTGTQETTQAAGANILIAAQGAGVRIYVTSLIVSNASATDSEVVIREGSSTVIATIPAPTVGGAIVNFPVPLKVPAVNEALSFGARDAVSTITVTAVGYSGI